MKLTCSIIGKYQVHLLMSLYHVKLNISSLSAGMAPCQQELKSDIWEDKKLAYNLKWSLNDNILLTEFL